MRPQRQMRKRLRPVATACPFCEGKFEPDYKDIGMLGKYVSERGKLVARSKTGLCSKHQRHLTTEVKRSRFVALMPFVVRA